MISYMCCETWNELLTNFAVKSSKTFLPKLIFLVVLLQITLKHNVLGSFLNVFI